MLPLQTSPSANRNFLFQLGFIFCYTELCLCTREDRLFLSLSLCFSLSVCVTLLSVCLCDYSLSAMPLCLCLPLSPFRCLSVRLSVSLPACLFTFLSFSSYLTFCLCLSFCLCLCLSVSFCLSVCLSVCLSLSKILLGQNMLRVTEERFSDEK